MTRADLKHCGKIPDAREELNRSVREGIIESRHSINSLEGMGSSSHDLVAELRMHSFTVNCDTFSNEEKVAAVVPVTSVEVTCSEAMLALSFSTLLVECLKKILGRSAGYAILIVCMWYTRNKFYSETAEENLQEAKIACDAESPWTYNIDIDSQK